MALTDAQMQAMQDAKDIDTGVDSRSKKEMLAQQMSDLKTIGKVGGELAVESIPGVSEEISMKNIQDALARGDKAGAGIEAGAMALGVVPFLGDAAAKGLRKFNKTRKAYKVAVQSEDKKLYPLFVNSDKELPVGEWIEADFPKSTFKGKRTPSSEEKNYVPTKGAKRTKGEKAKGTGVSIIIPDEVTRKNLIDEGFITEKTRKTKEAPFGKVTAVAARPGLHASQKPVATHLGPQDLKVSKKEVDKLLKSGITPEAIKRRGNQYYVKRRAEDQVFVEVDMADDVDYQSMLAKEGKSDINDYVPKGGSYKYSDGQADSDQWVVGGDMKINRVLSREEARAIQNEMGVVDLPYRDEVESILGKKFVKGGVVMDDYLVAKMMNENGSKQNFAEGGMPVAKQMEMFEDGGLMDEGGSIDPVSGNDVPPGSTQEEVRDDIPAQLSEGEFVFPADVVRFIGLGTLMQLRQQAKMGLKQMDAMGQMGNSEEATMPDDLPFDLNDLDMDDEDEYNGRQEFAVGGMPTPNPDTGVYYTPSAVQGTTGITTQQPMQAASSQYMAPQQQAVPTTAVPATMPSYEDFIQPTEGAKPELREYINAETGEKKSITFINNQPTTPIPEGFIPTSEYVKPETVKTEAVTTRSTNTLDEGDGEFGGSDARDFGGFANSLDSDAYSKMTAELGMYQGLSLNPKAALGSELAGKTTPKDVSTAMYQAKVAAIADLGIAKVDGNTIDYTNDDGTTKEASKEDLDFIAEVAGLAKNMVTGGVPAKEAAVNALARAKENKQMREAFAENKVADASGDGAGGSMDTTDPSSGGEEDVTGGDFSYGSPDDFESDLG